MELVTENVSALAEKLGQKPEVITKFLTDAKSEEVKTFSESLKSIHVFNETDLQTRIKNESADAIKKAETQAAVNAYSKIGGKIKDTWGIERKQDEPHLEYWFRAAEEKFKTPGKVDEAIQELKSQLSAKDKLLLEKEEAIKAKETEYSSKVSDLTIESKIDSVINNINIESKDAEDLNRKKAFLKYSLKEKYEIIVENNTLKFKDKITGAIKTDTKLANPMNEGDVINEFAPQVVSIKQTSQKRGLGLDAPLDLKTIGDSDMSKYETLQDLTKHMTLSGISLVGEKATEMYDKWNAHKNKK